MTERGGRAALALASLAALALLGGGICLVGGFAGLSSWVGSSPRASAPPPLEVARSPVSPEVVAALPDEELAALLFVEGGLVAATREGALLRIAPDGALTRSALPLDGEELLGLVRGAEGLVWASGREVGHVGGARIASGEIAALAGDGARAAWVDGERILVADRPGAPLVDALTVHVVFPGELALTPSLVVWADHGACDLWARHGEGAPTRIATGGRGVAQLTAEGDRVVWSEPEADLLPGRAGGLHLASHTPAGWRVDPLALPKSGNQMVLGDDGVLYGPAECAPLDADRWIRFDDVEGIGPVAVGGSHWAWTRPAPGGAPGLQIVRAPRQACRAEDGAPRP